MAQYTNYILVCGGTGCRASQSEQIIENLRAAVEQYGLEDTQVIRTGCFGFCEKGPVVKMIPDNTFYVQVQPSDADEIVREHLVKGRKVERLLYMNPETRELVPDSSISDSIRNSYESPFEIVALSTLRISMSISLVTAM